MILLWRAWDRAGDSAHLCSRSGGRKTRMTKVSGTGIAQTQIQATILVPLHPIGVIPQIVEVVS
jgi:hypothetical protein